MNRALAFLATIVVSFAAVPLSGQYLRARLVRDINATRTPQSSMPDGFGTAGGLSYFTATDAEHGTELWRSDGTEAGTRLVKDVIPGSVSGANQTLVFPFGSRVVYLAATAAQNREPWITDGTAEGTLMLGDLSPGTASTHIFFAVTSGQLLYFVASTSGQGTELWVTDGTPAGTRMVTNQPGTACPCPTTLVELGGVVYFGTSAGLYRIDAGGAPQQILTTSADELIAAGDRLYIRRFDAAAQTWTLSVFAPGSSSAMELGSFPGTASAYRGRHMTEGTTLYFAASDGNSGEELWRSNGTIAGTTPLTDINPGAGGSSIRFYSFAGRKLIFTATDGTAFGLYALDTPSGTTVRLLHNNLPTYVPLFAAGDRFLFAWDDGTRGRELWSTDGTTAGTAIVADINPGPPSAIAGDPFRGFSGSVFAADDGVHGAEPWTSDGTAPGTRMLRNVATDLSNDSGISGMRNVAGRLMFIAYDGPNAWLWTSDGTERGTVAVAPYAGFRSEHPKWIAAQDLYYFTQGDVPRMELWRSDGTAAGTFRLFTQNASRYIGSMAAFGRGLFFGGFSEANGVEPWLTDGTVAGTRMIKDIVPGTDGSIGSSIGGRPLVAGGKVHFGTYIPSDGSQAWMTDGTEQGTRQLGAITRGASTDSVRHFAEAGGTVYFVVDLHSTAFELWRKEGESGASLVQRVEGTSAPDALFNVGGKLMFMAGTRLMVSDGTTAGTRTIATVPPPVNCTASTDVAALGNVLIWTSYDFGRSDFPQLPAIWRSDGTTEGTYMLARLFGSFSLTTQTCWTRTIAVVGHHAYFVGTNGFYGAELWVTDGTRAGTHIIADVAPGPTSSDPDQLTAIGSRLYFSAHTPETGRELWTVVLPPSAPPRRRPSR